MNIRDRKIREAAKLLGCSKREVEERVKAYGRIDLNSLSWALKGEPYKPLTNKQRNVCGRCHLEKHLCFCSEFEKRLIAKRRKSAGN